MGRVRPTPAPMVYATVPRLWPDSTVVCLASGPSLTPADVDACRGLRLVCVNDTYRLAPWADVLYAADDKWWAEHRGVPTFHGLKFSVGSRAGAWGVQILKQTGGEGLERDPSGLRTGKNSGYQALNLAVHLGAKRILLLGYDMGHHHGKPSHFFGEHPARLRSKSPYLGFRQCFQTMVKPLAAAGIEVVNCSRVTDLACFPRQSLEQALAVATVAA